MKAKLTENGKAILIKKGYVKQGETIESLVNRVADAVAFRSPDLERLCELRAQRYASRGDLPPIPEDTLYSHGTDRPEGYTARGPDTDPEVAARRARFVQLLDSMRFIPNTPCLMNAGRPLAQLAACFVLPITDDLGADEQSGIFSTLRKAALIQQTGGGVGFDWSDVRAKGAVVASSGGTSSGPISFLRIYDAAFGGIAQGGCLTGDTLIMTSAGLLYMNEIMEQVPHTRGWHEGAPFRAIPISHDATTTNPAREYTTFNVDLEQHDATRQLISTASTFEGARPIVRAYVNGVARVFRVTLANGIEIKGTAEHKILVNCRDGQQWKHLCELARGDETITVLGQHQGVTQHIAQHALFVSGDMRPIEYPTEITPELAQLLGYIHAAGRISRKAVSDEPIVIRTVADSPITQRIIDLAQTVFRGCVAEIQQEDQSDWIVINNPAIVHFLVSNQLDGHDSSGIRVSPKIRCSPPNIVYSYIRAQLEICDVVGMHGYILVGDQQYAQEFATLLFGLGYSAIITRNDIQRRHIWRITVDAPTRTASRIYPLPTQCARVIDDGAKLFTKVASIKSAGSAPTFDMEVAGNHSYIANGVLVSNSRRGANMGILRVDHPDIEEFIECKSVEGAITNFNLSVALTEEFMRAVTCPDSGITPDHAHDFALRHVHGDHAIARIVDARELMRKIATHAHANGEPGVIFIDRINEDNPVPDLYRIAATNPCVTGETVIMTSDGPRFARDILHVPHYSIVNGESHQSMGFFETGFKSIVLIHTREGLTLRATPDHRILSLCAATTDTPVATKHDYARDPTMVSASQLKYGDKIAFSIPDVITWGTQSARNKSIGEKLARMCAFMALPPSMGAIDDTCATTDQPDTDFYEQFCAPGACDETAYNQLVCMPSDMQASFLQGICECVIDVESQRIGAIFVHLAQSRAHMMRIVIQCLANFGILTEECDEDYSKRVIRDPCDIDRYIHAIDPSLAPYMSAQARSRAHAMRYVTFDYIEQRDDCAHVYDCVVNDRHTFSANGMVVSNCGEVNLGPYENCCLGHVNLARHCDASGNIDWRQLEETVTDAVEFLDCVVSANWYVPSVQQLERAALAVRRIGLGITGLADLFLSCGYVYGSRESLNLADLIMAFIRVSALSASVKLARQWGAFPECARSVWAPNTVTKFLEDHLCVHLDTCARDDSRDARDRTMFADLLAKTREIGDQIKKVGIRNGALTVIAPTGTTSLILGVDGYGCEPVFSNSYTRTIADGSKMTFCRDSVIRALEQVVDSSIARDIGTLITKNAPLSEHIKVIEATLIDAPKTVRDRALCICRAAMATALNVSWNDHLAMQARLQTWIDNSISKTINCSPDTTIDDVMNIYIKAWRLRLKGVAIYRTASRAQEVLTSTSTSTSASAIPLTVTSTQQQSVQKRTRPIILHGLTSKYDTLFGSIFTTVNFDDTGNPFELFITIGKSGTEVQAESEAIGRLISLILRMDSSTTPSARVETIIQQLSNIGGSRDFRDVANRRTIRSIPDAVAIQLRDIMTSHSTCASTTCATSKHDDDTQGDRDICPVCKGLTLVKIERCVRCIDEGCSYSACS
ncbi:MAG: ribonucleotide reductase N-terminal alpha domain-containing protein [Candidatus Omnitrophota bacterium]